MCHESATIYLQCLHTENALTRCQNSYKSRGTKNKPSFLRTLFCVPTTARSQSCRPSKGRSSIDGLCTACSQAVRHRRETVDKMKTERPRHVHSRTREAKKPTKEERRRPHGKETFPCSKCSEEGRHTSARNRLSNGGLCCANGLREWESGRGQAHRSITPKRKPPPAAPVREHTLKRTPGKQHLRQSQSTLDARAAATAAAQRYKWTCDEGSSALEPNLVREYITMTGTGNPELPYPCRLEPRRAEPLHRAEPVYEEPQIDWDRWNSAPQTSHGRYPPADPAPDSPLPVRPLRPNRRHPSPPRIQTPNPDGDLGRRLTPAPLRLSGDSSEVLPLSTRFRSQDWGRGSSGSISPVSPMTVSPERMFIKRNQHGELRVDTVDEQLENAIRYWGD